MIAFMGTLAVLIAAFLPSDEPPPTPSEQGSQQDQAGRLNSILEQWHRQSAARTAYDVRFTLLGRSPAWGDKPYSGRVVLALGGRALYEAVRIDTEGKPAGEADRMVWTNQAFHVLQPDKRMHIVWPNTAEYRGRLPARLALPFLWRVNVAQLQARYSVTLIKEDADAYVLSFVPLTEAGRSSFTKAYLQLERNTFLPRRYLWVEPDGRSQKDFRLTESRINQPVSDDLFSTHHEKGWACNEEIEATIAQGGPKGVESKAAGWLANLLTPDPLP
jgi:hypothetical protein